MEESKLILYQSRINKKMRLLKPLILNLIVEKSVDNNNDTYILEHNELGLFAIQKTLERAKEQIRDQICELWKEYIRCPEDDLTVGGIRFRNKLLEYLSDNNGNDSR